MASKVLNPAPMETDSSHKADLDQKLDPKIFPDGDEEKFVELVTDENHMRTVFIQDIPEGVTKEDLARYFQEFGEIEKVSNFLTIERRQIFFFSNSHIFLRIRKIFFFLFCEKIWIQEPSPQAKTEYGKHAIRRGDCIFKDAECAELTVAILNDTEWLV